jgi:hypothetical protein
MMPDDADEPGDSFVVDDLADATEGPKRGASHEAELNSIRIRQLAAEKRSTYRQRSYCIMAVAVCVVGILQLGWMTWQHLRSLGWTARPIGYVLFMILFAWLARRFTLRAIALHRAAKRSLLGEPSTPPDFSSLDDGSKQWKNLEDVK